MVQAKSNPLSKPCTYLRAPFDSPPNPAPDEAVRLYFILHLRLFPHPQQRNGNRPAADADLDLCAAFGTDQDTLRPGCGFADQPPAMAAVRQKHLNIACHSPCPLQRTFKTARASGNHAVTPVPVIAAEIVLDPPIPAVKEHSKKTTAQTLNHLNPPPFLLLPERYISMQRSGFRPHEGSSIMNPALISSALSHYRTHR